jgi:hypothetical protein
MEDDLKERRRKKEDDIKKNGRQSKKMGENGRPTKNKNKKLFSIPLKFRAKPFLGLSQFSKIFTI